MSKKSSQSLAVELDRFVAPFRIDGSREFHLKSHNAAEKGGLDKDKAEKIIEANHKRLADFQEKLFAQDRWSLLVILQGMDAAGKDSAVKHIFDGVNPQGCEVYSFKQPTSHELDHDFMWRTMIALPQRRVPGDAGASGNPHQTEDPAAPGRQQYLARTVRGYFRVRALSDAPGHGSAEILSQYLKRGAARALSRSSRPACQELEVLDARRRRARVVGEVSGRLPGGGPPHLQRSGAMVRRTGRSQMVRAGGDQFDHRPHAV